MASVLLAWAIKSSGKNSIHNLQDRPQPRLVKSIYIMTLVAAIACALSIPEQYTCMKRKSGQETDEPECGGEA